jgi:NitT/TauT family transport system permease protein
MTDHVAEAPVVAAKSPPPRRTAWHTLARSAAARRALVLAVLAALWQLAATVTASPLLLPSFTRTIAAFWDALLAAA